MWLGEFKTQVPKKKLQVGAFMDTGLRTPHQHKRKFWLSDKLCSLDFGSNLVHIPPKSTLADNLQLQLGPVSTFNYYLWFPQPTSLMIKHSVNIFSKGTALESGA